MFLCFEVGMLYHCGVSLCAGSVLIINTYANIVVLGIFMLIFFFFFFVFFYMYFFFQAEDGIRDLVRSRGLGDVYKRQSVPGPQAAFEEALRVFAHSRVESSGDAAFLLDEWLELRTFEPVSYTHLTLPTSDLV